MAVFSADPDFTRRSARLSDCGSHGRLYLEGDPPHVRLWIHRCGDRLCPLCAWYRSVRVRKQLEAVAKRCEDPRHIVLTLQTFPGGSLAAAVAHLRESFRRLRKHEAWISRVRGGAYTVQVTYNRQTNTWHPHLHLLADADYWQHKHFSDVWLDCSRGSPVVWITRAHKDHPRYIAHDAGRPDDLDTWPHDQVIEYATVTASMRMVQTFGCCHGLKVEDADPRPEIQGNRHTLNLAVLRSSALNGHRGAITLLAATAERWPVLAGFAGSSPRAPPSGSPRQREELLRVRQAEVDRLAALCPELTTPQESTSEQHLKISRRSSAKLQVESQEGGLFQHMSMSGYDD